MNGLTIGKAASMAGVGVETIRFYERRGLIERPPKGDGYRCYSPSVIDRIRFIRRAQQIGFSLREVEELLSLHENPRADCGDVREKAAAKAAEIDRKVKQLNLMRTALEQVIASCPGRGALRACSIIEALVGTSTPESLRPESQGDSSIAERLENRAGDAEPLVAAHTDRNGRV